MLSRFVKRTNVTAVTAVMVTVTVIVGTVIVVAVEGIVEMLPHFEIPKR